MNFKIGILSLMFATVSFSVSAQGKYGETEQDSLECLKNLSLYQEYYKQESYDDAVEPLMKAVELCPASSKNMYIRGANLFSRKLKQAKGAGDDENVAAYLDTLVMFYDKRMEHFGERGYVLGRKGTDLLRFGTAEEYPAGYEALAESFEIEGENTQAGVVAALFQAAYFVHKKDELEKSEILDLYIRLSDVVKKNIAEGEKVKAYKSAQNTLDKMLAKIADCEDLINTFEPKYKESPEDAELLKQFVGLLDELDCTNEDIYLEVSMKLDEIEPSGEAKYAIGKALIKEQQYEKAVTYLKEAADLLEQKELKLDAYKYAGKALLQLKKYASVKSVANQALQVDANYGEAYMLIGDAYYYGSTTVGDNKCEKAGGYWAAIPKYNRAKSLDGELADKADQRIASAREQFPKKNDCFFEDITDGEKMEVGGWINETVTVETR